MVKAFKRLNVPPSRFPGERGATTFFVKHRRGDTAIVAVNVAGCTPIQIAALLCHEAVHIKQEICLLWGETNPSPEFEAYTVQTIAQELMESYCEQSYPPTN